jgi:glyoxylase-like metal-dependent hydrolase (beta-lactamase superfamily II)
MQASNNYFSCKQLNSTTFLIVEHDSFSEKPFIYAKTLKEQGLLVLSDTGCGGNGSINLRSFIETVPIPENSNIPLNPLIDGSRKLKYLVICTHCHYDHILGIPDFVAADAEILASAAGKAFIDKDLPEHSLCAFLDLPTPSYKVSHWANDFETICAGKLQVLQTPGHTPDELAWYDIEERHLYVGDSFYNRLSDDGSYDQNIVFPPHGSLISYMASVSKLRKFVAEKNTELPHVKVGCGHTTSSADAATTLAEVEQFFLNVVKGKVPIKASSKIRDILFHLWQEEGHPRFSVFAPSFLVEDARKHEEYLKLPSYVINIHTKA